MHKILASVFMIEIDKFLTLSMRAITMTSDISEILFEISYSFKSTERTTPGTFLRLLLLLTNVVIQAFMELK